MHSWTVRDFKAIGFSRIDFKNKNLTILCGVNSSGKSSILQSLLLLTQCAYRTGSITLNGQLVRLGLGSDVIRDGQKSTQFEFLFPLSDLRTGTQTKEMEVRVSLENAENKADLTVSDFELVEPDSGRPIFNATSSRINGTDRAEILEVLDDDQLIVLRITIENGKKARNRRYILLRGLVPVAVAQHSNSARIRKLYAGSLIPLANASQNSLRLRYVFVELARLISKKDYLKLVSNRDGIEIQFTPSVRWSPADWKSLSDKQKLEVADIAAGRRSENPWIIQGTDSYRLPPRIGRAHDGLIEVTTSNDDELTLHMLSEVGEQVTETGGLIKYLGPLRDEPRVVHSAWDERVEPLPVGIRGELTAEVLTRLNNVRINYGDMSGNRRNDLFTVAVSKWCSYLGIGDEISVTDHGKLGRGVQLQVDGADRDLTTIGVGASQLLPVLVAVLSAPPRSILLVEQPELHLHPAVQSRLADFFLFARTDIKLVIETHSEYVVTRLRRRVAEDSVDPARIEVVFVEHRDTASIARSVPINDLGDFEFWPEGFFDAQDIDSLAIIRAIDKKIEKRAHNG
ncbi:hypothetical protein CH294_18105 [Rhodococcus sp. 14-2483-1-1]|uniref:AAA family ATPase n=1 Tax=Rhodococcus sp. 14-2483-1-1 TaxID=2023148 RepID=UPI000B9B0650|nr:DUF3696 domain-containing protein [Rhodococcus sp. 14-2483-1-1]OZF33042.1 hypothetical protein CH294_18105 [Rhodococcus sp. 14-2483-1-1]